MELVFQKSFVRQYQKLREQQKTQIDDALARFVDDPHSSILRNHALRGQFKGLRSIDAAFDLRVIFKEEGGYMVVYLLQVGTHSQLY